MTLKQPFNHYKNQIRFDKTLQAHFNLIVETFELLQVKLFKIDFKIQELNLEQADIEYIYNIADNTSFSVEFLIETHVSKVELKSNFLITNKIVNKLPSCTFKYSIKIPFNMTLADSNFNYKTLIC